jgi:hypothetical protein
MQPCEERTRAAVRLPFYIALLSGGLVITRRCAFSLQPIRLLDDRLEGTAYLCRVPAENGDVLEAL